ncbi:MAG TPA: serine hydrolase domain-containing protein [Gemmatimonadaceae bacterium]|nr:serine hydrolase domain-containing protein [Gemmatimonadaceae bacterium]
MPRLHTTLAAALACGLLALPLHAQAPASAPDSSLAHTVDSISTAVLASTGVPSASVAVVRHGQVVYANAYGKANLEQGTAATPAMRYGIGSVSKQFTAAAILLLAEQGKLSLDDPVGKYIPGLTQGNQVTIRELLSHTSGYQDFWPQDYLMTPMKQSVTPRQIADRWGKQPLDFAPGTRWQYSNTNYTLAGMVIEKASGMPFWKFVQTRILEPPRLTSAKDFDANPRAADATGYIRYALGPLHPAPDTGSGWMWAAGELAMTATDLARWDSTMIHHGLLRPSSWHEMEREVRLANGAGTGYGLGVDVSMAGGHFLVEHSGEVSGFVSENMVFPDDSVAVVVLTNQDAAPAASAIASAIGHVLFTTEDAVGADRTAKARAILEALRAGTIDRSQLTPDASDYFTPEALKDFAASLAPLGDLRSFVLTATRSRGGMTMRSYRAVFADRALRVWTYETPDGKLEQYQVAPIS